MVSIFTGRSHFSIFVFIRPFYPSFALMPDVIHLLSDHLANQIAAGEVIQRPASAVKELLENAVDAGATEVILILKDAGKELIQVTDNGKGMSPADARMSFERHATSKIRNINDLFSIRTMGFRGEALASIAAVAKVEMRTRPHAQAVGTRLVIEGTEVVSQEPDATPPGTSILVKNLFYNIPARRNFLKSNATEYRQIIDEFTRVTMASPHISFRLINEGTEKMRLDTGSLKSRILGLLGSQLDKNLVPVQEDLEVMKINGFIGKPAAAGRSRGQQFFFINNRFIRSPYLNHAVTNAYASLIEKEAFPPYFLFLEVDPARVDVNVHPTKQEVKFEDDKLMYAYLSAAVKHALSQYNISPALDFSLTPEIQQLAAVQLPQTAAQKEAGSSGYLAHNFSGKNQAHAIRPTGDLKRWQALYQIAGSVDPPDASQLPAAAGAVEPASVLPEEEQTAFPTEDNRAMLTLQGSLLVSTVKSGLMLVHIARAKERIWYERLSARLQQAENAPSQRLLFPVNVELPPADALAIEEVLPALRKMGLEIAAFGASTFVIHGLPGDMPPGNEQALLEAVAERLKHNAGTNAAARQDELARGLALRLARNTTLSGTEAREALIDELFRCSQPEYTSNGRKVFAIIPRDELDKWLV